MASGHTPRSLKHLRAQGYPLVTVVEKWQMVPGHPGGGVRQDLFGIIDIIALRHGETLAVQVTSAGQFTAHLRKIREHVTLVDGKEYPTAGLILDAGWRIEVHGWEKVKNRYVLKRTKEFIL